MVPLSKAREGNFAQLTMTCQLFVGLLKSFQKLRKRQFIIPFSVSESYQRLVLVLAFFTCFEGIFTARKCIVTLFSTSVSCPSTVPD